MSKFFIGFFLAFAVIEYRGGYPANECSMPGVMVWVLLAAIWGIIDLVYSEDR
jgi:hypothetical protein